MSPIVAPSAVAKQAEQLKQDGNNYFQKSRFGAAIDAYTEAITLCPNVPIYWTNRALCHRKLNDWTRVEEDCRRAIQLDHSSVKAHYILGLALLQKEQYAEGVRELAKVFIAIRDFNESCKNITIHSLRENCCCGDKEICYKKEDTGRHWILEEVLIQRVTWLKRSGRSLQKQNTWSGSMNLRDALGNLRN